jgi:hypothetical protein
MEVDLMGTVQIKIKGEASAMILHPHTGVKATTMADTDRLRATTRILTRSHHQDRHHRPHPQAKEVVEAAHMATA